jgi:hypothetical protein
MVVVVASVFVASWGASGDSAVRPSARVGRLKKRHSAVASTALAQLTMTARPMPERPSVPVKNPWARAATKASQLNQWMNRHDVFAIRVFIRLEAHTARIKSKATAPMATSTRLYDEVMGTTVDSQPVGT